MSQFSYNGVTLPYATIHEFHQDPVREESDTDWCKTRVEVKLTCVINLDYIAMIAPAAAAQANSVADIIYLLRQSLLEHRKAMSISFEGEEIIPRKMLGNSGTVDADNGPKPQSCVFFELTNKTFMLSYHIIAHYWETHQSGSVNIGANNFGNNILYNRWSESNEIDDCNFVKRVRMGKYVIRSDNLDGLTADELRSQMAVVSVPYGCVRLNSNYTVTPDGLGILYRVEDQEVYKMPPAPAFKATGSYRETATIQAANFYGECTVALKADYFTSQQTLFQTAADVAISYIRSREKTSTKWCVIEQVFGEFNFYDNSVIFSARVRTTRENKTANLTVLQQAVKAATGSLLNNPLNVFTRIPFTVPGSPLDNNDYIPAYRDRGSAGFLLKAAAYYDPSLREVVLGPSRTVADNNPLKLTPQFDAQVQLTQGRVPGTAGKNAES